MARPRTGSLELRKGVYHARLTVTRDGKDLREWFTLDTSDHATAQKRLAKLVAEKAAGRSDEAAARAAGAPRVAAYAATVASRLSGQDQANLRTHVLPRIGRRPLDEVEAEHIQRVCEGVATSNARRHGGKRKPGEVKVLEHRVRRSTVAKVLGAMRRLFQRAVKDGHIKSNPARDVELDRPHGKDREIIKPRSVLSDAEIARFLACDEADLELRMMSITARCEGGMRTGDLRAWDWTMIDIVNFGTCSIPRNKTAAPEVLDVPEVLRPFLRAWWERSGKPVAGPVFPVRKGKRVGEFRASKASHAKRLRRDLVKAGVFRLPPIQVSATKPGTRTDRGRRVEGTRLAPSPADPLYYETATSLPVDFHSFRRAFNSALADAGVNVQHAMKLAGHSNVSTHMRYVSRSKAMQSIPDAALPNLSGVAIGGNSTQSTVNQGRSEDDENGLDTPISSQNQALLDASVPSSKPLVRGSNPFGRAEIIDDFGRTCRATGWPRHFPRHVE